MKRIISVSRRTDIPAFYGDWFMNRLKSGFAGYRNPFGGQKYLVSLKPVDVVAFVFWSKNFTPFLENLRVVESLGYKFYFNYTITGLPHAFLCNLVETDDAIAALKELSRRYSPRHINWRYDPIVISGITDYAWHVKRFSRLASDLEGYAERCFFSYAIRFGKVQRNFEKFEKQNNIRMLDLEKEERIELACKLAEIAHQHGIRLMTCCGDYLLGPAIEKAHCVDGRVIEELLSPTGFNFRQKPSRKECGCTESTDIGAYDTCPHGCIYCYANVNKEIASGRFRDHDPNSAFLGCGKTESDAWAKELMGKEQKKPRIEQTSLF